MFGYGVVIYFTIQSSFEKISKNSPYFPSQRGNPPSAILFILTAATAITPHTKSYEIAPWQCILLKNSTFLVFLILYVTLHNNGVKADVINFTFIDIICALQRAALNKNRNTVFIWSVEMCFIFLAQIIAIFMQPLYEAVIWCDCIINNCFLTRHKVMNNIIITS